MAYVSSATYLSTRLQKTFSSCESKEEWPHADNNYITITESKWNLFKWTGLFVDRLTGPSWCLFEIPEVGATVQTFL